MSLRVNVLRVFTDAAGRHGNYLGVVLDGTAIDGPDRFAIAGKLGFSATVFVDNAASGSLRIYTPAVELAFAGHPVVGAAWQLRREAGHPPIVLRPPAGDVPTWQEDDATWLTAPLAGTPPWWHERLGSADEVAALRGPLHPSQDATQLWAWRDEPAGLVRARVFAARLGIVEDEACGSASMRLCAALGRPLTVEHGDGSVIAVRPGAVPGTADVGGRVTAEPDRWL
jgi:predicted PhzF superfamily epimerase YddE/YHI9